MSTYFGKRYIRDALSTKEGALTACKTLVETALKHLLDDQEIAHSTKDDIKDLYKKFRMHMG